MMLIKDYILNPIYKVMFGVFAVFTIVLISPILTLAIAYILFYNSEYLEYINPDLGNLHDEEGES